MNFANLLHQAHIFAKLAQDPTAAIQQILIDTLRSIPGTKLREMKVGGGQVNAEIEVPAKHSFTASQLGNSLTAAIQQVAPGFKVIPILSFSTAKHAQVKSSDQEALAKNAVMQALQGNKLLSFVWQPETKHILAEVKKFNNKVSAQQLSAYLTAKVQEAAPGFSVTATLST
jgi:hypothetical protein